MTHLISVRHSGVCERGVTNVERVYSSVTERVPSYSDQMHDQTSYMMQCISSHDVLHRNQLVNLFHETTLKTNIEQRRAVLYTS